MSEFFSKCCIEQIGPHNCFILSIVNKNDCRNNSKLLNKIKLRSTYRFKLQTQTMQAILITCLVLLILMVHSIESVVDNTNYQRPKPLKTMDLIRSRGFDGQMYSIKANGYPLTLYRIINPLADQTRINKYPVLYGHGILYDAMNMISRSEHSRPRVPIPGVPTVKYGNTTDKIDDFSLPFMFSNNNFDVWLYDAKGSDNDNTNLSVKINPKKAHKFWDFSLDEESLVDLPLLIDFVLKETASSKLVYVGYSESTLFLFALLSAEPKYADKIAAFVALAPVAYASHIKGVTLPLFGALAYATPNILHYSYFPQPLIDSIDIFFRGLCQTRGLGRLICKPIFDSIAGRGNGEMGPGLFSKFYHLTSLKAIKHFAQLSLGNRFGMFDYGKAENMRRYGQAEPPEYDLSKIKLDRIILCRGLEDILSAPEDQVRLIKELGTKPYMDIVVPEYNHFDFIDGKHLIREVNAPIINGVYKLLLRDNPNILKNQTSPPHSAYCNI